MKLIQIYQCLCDETRLRILHLLSKESLCVCELQRILLLSQVKVSKHLHYLRERGMVEARRIKNRMIYSLAATMTSELEKNLNCLKECIGNYPIFEEDFERLKESQNEKILV